jgi:hypothetical protein
MPGLALALLAVVLLVGPSAAAERPDAPVGKAKLTLVQDRPLVVRGSRFVPRERVRVFVVGGVSKRVTATRSGAFAARFPNAYLDRCAGYTIRAEGSRGSRAVLKSPPTFCPPP